MPDARRPATAPTATAPTTAPATTSAPHPPELWYAGPDMRPVAVLVRLPGAGKSTVGRLLAGRLGVGLRDTDEDVERRTGQSVAEIFATQGEGRFRELERAAVRAALAHHRGVLALGGGAVEDPGTRALLVGGPVVHVDAGVREVLGRRGAVTGRPLLAGDAAVRLRELAARRAPLYREVARVTVTPDGRGAEEVADAVLRALAMG
ncbi:shikimate kinase [Streptomyces sp. NPDC003374]